MTQTVSSTAEPTTVAPRAGATSIRKEASVSPQEVPQVAKQSPVAQPTVSREPAVTHSASPLIYSKMARILADVDPIRKGQKNVAQNFKFRGIDDVYNELHGVFAKHGVFTTTSVLTQERVEKQSRAGGTINWTVLTIKFTFWAEDGSSVDSIVIGEAADSGDKGANKALSIAHKYCLLQAFLIPTEDEKDPDFVSPHFGSASGQSPRPRPEARDYRAEGRRSETRQDVRDRGVSFESSAAVEIDGPVRPVSLDTDDGHKKSSETDATVLATESVPSQAQTATPIATAVRHSVREPRYTGTKEQLEHLRELARAAGVAEAKVFNDIHKASYNKPVESLKGVIQEVLRAKAASPSANALPF